MFPCPVCKRSFDTSRGLSNHSRVHRNNGNEQNDNIHDTAQSSRRQSGSSRVSVNSNEENTPTCPFCSRTFDTERGLNQHIQKSHKEDGKQTRSAGKQEFQRNIVCRLCSQSFDSKHELHQHLSRLHRDRHDRYGSWQASLTQTEEKDVKLPFGLQNGFAECTHRCPLCDRTFDTERGLSQHISRSHKEEKGHQNGMSKFKESTPLCPKTHQTGTNAEGSFTCPFCDRNFDTLRGLNQHINKSHKETDQQTPPRRKHAEREGQDHCIKREMQWHNHSTEKTEKEEDKPLCPFCGRIFDTLRGLNQHIFRSHDEKNEQTRPTGKKVEDYFTCPFCDRNFDTHRGLNQHIIRSHKKTDLYSPHRFKFSENEEDDDQWIKREIRYRNGGLSDPIELLYRRGSKDGDSPSHDTPRDTPRRSTSDGSGSSSSESHECFCCEKSFDSDFKLGIHIGKEHLDDSSEDQKMAPVVPQSLPEDVLISKKGLKKLEIDLTLDKEEVSDAARYVNEFVDKFQELLEQHSPFKLDIFRSGSYYDKTKINSPDEFDFMFLPVDLMVEPQYCRELPGYCKVRIHGLIPTEYKGMVERGYLVPSKFKAKMFDVFSTCVESPFFHKGRRTTRYERPPESPAYTVLYEAVPGKQPIDIDLVPSIQFPGWPKVARKLKPHWIKRNYAEKAMVNFHAVTKDCPQDVPDKHLYWRISFSSAEKILVRHANNGDKGSPRKYVFKMMKHLIHKIKEGHRGEIQKFCSYHLKMFMLNEYDSWRKRQFQAKDKKALILQTISRLHACIQGDSQGNPIILNYFIRSDNVLRFVPRGERQLLCSCLENYINE